jgi:hypothetical protein
LHLMIVGIIMVQRILWKGGLDMKFGPIEIKDKSNRTIVLRNATPEDAEDLITYLKVTTAETPYLIREPEEVIMTQEQETAFFVCYFLTGRICSHFTMRSIKVIIKTRKSWKL